MIPGLHPGPGKPFFKENVVVRRAAVAEKQKCRAQWSLGSRVAVGSIPDRPPPTDFATK
jgi:hypothetical protein